MSVAINFPRSPVVSFLYERGWRQSFNRGGFPGPDEEVNFFIALIEFILITLWVG